MSSEKMKIHNGRDRWKRASRNECGWTIATALTDRWRASDRHHVLDRVEDIGVVRFEGPGCEWV